MTGRELIIYILRNKLEDAEVFDGNVIVGLTMTVEKAASKFNVGAETIRLWYAQNLIKGLYVHGKLYIIANAKDPRDDDYTRIKGDNDEQ